MANIVLSHVPTLSFPPHDLYPVNSTKKIKGYLPQQFHVQWRTVVNELGLANGIGAHGIAKKDTTFGDVEQASYTARNTYPPWHVMAYCILHAGVKSGKAPGGLLMKQVQAIAHAVWPTLPLNNATTRRSLTARSEFVSTGKKIPGHGGSLWRIRKVWEPVSTSDEEVKTEPSSPEPAPDHHSSKAAGKVVKTHQQSAAEEAKTEPSSTGPAPKHHSSKAAGKVVKTNHKSAAASSFPSHHNSANKVTKPRRKSAAPSPSCAQAQALAQQKHQFRFSRNDPMDGVEPTGSPDAIGFLAGSSFHAANSSYPTTNLGDEWEKKQAAREKTQVDGVVKRMSCVQKKRKAALLENSEKEEVARLRANTEAIIQQETQGNAVSDEEMQKIEAAAILMEIHGYCNWYSDRIVQA